MAESADIVYRVNREDRIEYVNDAWEQFANDNEGDAFASASVLDQSLWNFISDQTTRDIYRSMMRSARDGSVVNFTFRCDAPALRRELRMHVEAREAQSVEFRTETVRTEVRESQALLDPATPRNQELLRSCSWCRKVWVEDEWVEVEVAVERLQLFHAERLPELTHGICEPCFKLFTAVDEPVDAE
jgi:hypothetical protein